MTTYNRVILIGNLAEDPDVRYTPSGLQVTTFALRIDPSKDAGSDSIPQVIDVLAFEKARSRGDRPFSKGTLVLVEGKIQKRSWETMEGQKRSKLEIVADRVYPLEDVGS